MPHTRLSEHGKIEAAKIAQRMSREQVTAILTSPMQRCRETAAFIAATTARDPVVTEGWNEIDFGSWTGRSFDALQHDPAWRTWNVAREIAVTPAGVSMSNVQSTTLAAIQAIQDQHGGGRVVVVSHGDIIKATVSFYLGIPVADYTRFDIDPASISTLAVWPGGGKIMNLNQTSWQ